MALRLGQMGLGRSCSREQWATGPVVLAQYGARRAAARSPSKALQLPKAPFWRSGNWLPEQPPRMSRFVGRVVYHPAVRSSFTCPQAIFSQCGTIKDAWTLPSSNAETTVIRVKFTERDGMLKAIKQFDGQVADGRTLSVKEIGATRQKDLIDENMEEDNEASGSKG